MDEVHHYLRTSLRMDHFGARGVTQGEHTLILYHLPEWGDAHGHRLRARFPDCEVTMMSNRSSEGGFTVVVRRHEHPLARLWASLLVLAAILVAYAVFRLHMNDAGARGTI